MSVPFPRRTAAELMDAAFLAKWADRAALSPAARTAVGEILDFFRSEEHVAEWWAVGRAPGAAATLPEAFRLGATIFGELLPRLLRAP